jgi:lantibiotic biosynthesis protein
LPVKPSTSWKSLYRPESAQRPLRIAFEIARRLAEPQMIEQTVMSARAGTKEPWSIHWHPHEIAQGDAGVALMYGYFDACFPGQGWDQVAHQWIERAARGAEAQERVPGGLFEGWRPGRREL